MKIEAKETEAKDETEDKGGEAAKPAAKKADEAKSGETEDGGDEEADEEEAKPEAKKPEARRSAKVDPEDPAVKKLIEKARKEEAARVRKEAKEEAEQKAKDAKLSEDERLRKEAKEAEAKRTEAEQKLALAESREALRDAMDDLEVKPAGGKARATIVAEFVEARAKNPDADPAELIAALRKSDAYLFVSTKAAPAKTEDAEDKPSKTDTRGGKTTTSAKSTERKDDNVIALDENDPRKIRANLAASGVKLSS